MFLRFVVPWNKRLLRIDDGGALIEELPDSSRCSLISGIHLVGIPATFDLQQGLGFRLGARRRFIDVFNKPRGGAPSTLGQYFIRPKKVP